MCRTLPSKISLGSKFFSRCVSKNFIFSGEFCLPQLTLNFFVTPDLLEIDWSRSWVGQQLHVKEKDKQETRAANVFPKLHKNLRSIISCVWFTHR
jgi:hypothetical protein